VPGPQFFSLSFVLAFVASLRCCHDSFLAVLLLLAVLLFLAVVLFLAVLLLFLAAVVLLFAVVLRLAGVLLRRFLFAAA
jgi:hypothetical protein